MPANPIEGKALTDRVLPDSVLWNHFSNYAPGSDRGDFDLRTRPQAFEESSRPPLPLSHSHHRAVRPRRATLDCPGRSAKRFPLSTIVMTPPRPRSLDPALKVPLRSDPTLTYSVISRAMELSPIPLANLPGRSLSNTYMLATTSQPRISRPAFCQGLSKSNEHSTVPPHKLGKTGKSCPDKLQLRYSKLAQHQPIIFDIELSPPLVEAQGTSGVRRVHKVHGISSTVDSFRFSYLSYRRSFPAIINLLRYLCTYSFFIRSSIFNRLSSFLSAKD